MVPSIRVDHLKKSQTQVHINNNYYLEVNWPWLCNLVREKFVLTLNLNLNHREIWSPKWRLNKNFSHQGENVSRTGDSISHNFEP